MSVVEYEKKYTELSKYAASVLIDERARSNDLKMV